MGIDVARAKASWDGAGLSDAGRKQIDTWIDALAANIANGKGRWDAYGREAFCTSDIRGSVGVLKNAVEQTSK